MCGLFGFKIYGDVKTDYSELLQSLAEHSAERGTHATGISYISDNKLVTYKKPMSAFKLKLMHCDGVRTITGHTRHATQGDYKLNHNNHPFTGHTKNGDIFSIAHNGIIYNDSELRQKYHLSKSKITTDSYIYCQLLEKSKNLDFKSIAEATEVLQGYYTFSLLDGKNQLYIVKGDSPISIVHIPELKMYIYASTDSILYNSLLDSGLFKYIKSGKFSVVELNEGDILKIADDGKLSDGRFQPCQTSYNWRNWYDYSTPSVDDEYLYSLIDMAEFLGYDESDIQQLIDDGYSLTDIEEYIYGGDLA